MNCLLISDDGRIVGAAYVTTDNQCIDFQTSADSPVSSYSLLLMTPQDTTDSVSALPPPEDMAAAWGVGFVMVVGCYVIARSVGAVVNFIDSK